MNIISATNSIYKILDSHGLVVGCPIWLTTRPQSMGQAGSDPLIYLNILSFVPAMGQGVLYPPIRGPAAETFRMSHRGCTPTV